MSKKNPSDVVIVSALRTPLCRAKKGGLAKVHASTLVTAVLKATLRQGRIEGHELDDICLGNCLMPPSGFAAMRMAQIIAGIPETVPFHSINRQCSSGLQAVAHIANAIATGQIEVGLAGGVESMSMNPM
jgi:acetyl-CoA acyltransferase 1